MPILMDQIAQGTKLEWYGDVWTRRVQNAVRGALMETAIEVHKVAINLVHKDTTNLALAIAVKFPRRTGRNYSVEVGVFRDLPDPGLRSTTTKWGSSYNEQAWQYAYWQETLPEPRGKAFLRPAMDQQGKPDQIADRIRRRLAYRSGATPSGVDATMGQWEENFEQTYRERWFEGTWASGKVGVNR